MKYQVRNMVGILIRIGEEKLEPRIIDQIFDDYSMRKLIITAKPEGLSLINVKY